MIFIVLKAYFQTLRDSYLLKNVKTRTNKKKLGGILTSMVILKHHSLRVIVIQQRQLLSSIVPSLLENSL